MKKVLLLVLTASFISTIIISPCFADGPEDEIAALKAQVQALMQRIEKLESAQAKSKEDSLKAQEEVKKIKETTSALQTSKVDLLNALSKLKIKGRAAAGYFDSQKAGSYPNGSVEVPEAKIQFSFQPDDINTFVLRFNLNNATTNISSTSPLLDYFYLQSKDFIPSLKNTPFSLSGRLGRFKLGFGEETWSNNLVEGILPSNSAGNVGVSDEGLELSGKIKLDKIKLQPLGWSLSLSDGNSGVGSDTTGAKAVLVKLYQSPAPQLYLSGSYYDSGHLKASSADMSIAGLVAPPTGTTEWVRKVWEADLRYDFGKGKKPLDPIVFSDSKAILRLSYGQWGDYALGAAKRNGQFGFVDAIYNLTNKFYTAGRFSLVDLDGDQTAALNSVTANMYQRYSLGFGYRWSENTIVKLGYDWNKESQASTGDRPNNLFSALVAAQF